MYKRNPGFFLIKTWECRACCLCCAVREGTFSINSHQVCSAQRSQPCVLRKPWKTCPEMEWGSHCGAWGRFSGTSAAVIIADTGLGFSQPGLESKGLCIIAIHVLHCVSNPEPLWFPQPLLQPALPFMFGKLLCNVWSEQLLPPPAFPEAV